MATCSQLTVKGEPCKNPTMPGTDRCGVHIRAEPSWNSLLTPEVAERLTAMLRAGNYDEVAAKAAGVAPRTLREWLQRGLSSRPEDELYRDLRERVEKARAEGEAVHVARIAQAAQQDWHASAWFLERSYPERWGRVSPRPFEPEIPEQPVETPPAEPGLFDEVDELARKRARRV